MKDILFVCPTSGNGGIQSWTRKMLSNYSDDEFALYHVNVSHRRSVGSQTSPIIRAIDGVLDLVSVYWRVKKALKQKSFSLMHTTTSGNIGSLRDFFLAKLCHKHHVKCIMHCRYGCIPEDFEKKGFWGNLLRKTMHLYDNIWVLDKRSETALNTDPLLVGKVFLTPNSITVPSVCDLSPKCYKKIAFVGNLIRSKGLFELIHAVADYDLDVELSIVGPDNSGLLGEIMQVAGNKWGTAIKYLGKLPNDEAVRIIKQMDMIALPSYYPSEAFPISIIEAMSFGKMVIASRRAAIQDMLTDLDGKECGYFVREKSVEDIVAAIRWCQNNKCEADKRCSKAYEKVKACYSISVIYELYRNLYRKLIG